MESVLCQLGKDDEIIVSDDGSTDNTLELIKAFNDPRIKIFHYKQTPVRSRHHGFIYAARNFENALRHAKGEYIFLCDQDDIWNKDKIKIMLPYLEKYDCVHHAQYDMYSDGTPMQLHPTMPEHNDIIRSLKGMRFSGCCMAITRRLRDKALPIPRRLPSHDGWIGCLAIMNNSYYFIKEPLIRHRIHETNVSHRADTKRNLLYSFGYRMRILTNVLTRSPLKKIRR